MNPRFEAAWEIHQFLTARGIAYAIIGGTALPRWGEPRFTKDVDLFDEQLPEPHAVADFERAWRAEKRAAREARQSYQTRRK